MTHTNAAKRLTFFVSSRFVAANENPVLMRNARYPHFVPNALVLKIEKMLDNRTSLFVFQSDQRFQGFNVWLAQAFIKKKSWSRHAALAR